MPFTKVSNTVKNNSQAVEMTNTTDSVSTATGTLIVDGGGAYKKRLSVGTAILFPIWTTGIAYVVGDVVKHATLQDLYVCVVGHTSGTFTTDIASGDWSKVTTNFASNSTSTITADYTILDYDGFETIYADSNARAVTVTLPTLAANLGRVITVKKISSGTSGGWVNLYGEGGTELIDGLSGFKMYSAGDHISVVGQTGGWKILTGHATYSTGWINTADWSNRHLGTMQVVTKTGDASLYTVGELLTEETTGNTFRLDAISGGVGGTFTLRAISGTGHCTIHKKFTGSTSGRADAAVNAATKNQDNTVIHNFGRVVRESSVLYNATATDTDALELTMFCYLYGVTNTYGVVQYNTDLNNITMHTGDSGVTYLSANGTYVSPATTDVYYKVITEAII